MVVVSAAGHLSVPEDAPPAGIRNLHGGPAKRAESDSQRKFPANAQSKPEARQATQHRSSHAIRPRHSPAVVVDDSPFPLEPTSAGSPTTQPTSSLFSALAVCSGQQQHPPEHPPPTPVILRRPSLSAAASTGFSTPHQRYATSRPTLLWNTVSRTTR